MFNPTEAFKKCIKSYLDDFASNDLHFKNCYENKNKNLDSCCNYIIGQVKNQNRCAFTNDEIFQYARHYYLEEIKESETKEVSNLNKIVITEGDELINETPDLESFFG